MRKFSTRAFTLIELSIVLVVIGLIAAGVVSGRNIIEAARMRALLAETMVYRNGIRMYYAANGDYPYQLPPGYIVTSSQFAGWPYLVSGGFIPQATYSGGCCDDRSAPISKVWRGQPYRGTDPKTMYNLWIWSPVFGSISPPQIAYSGSVTFPNWVTQAGMLHLTVAWRWAADSMDEGLMTPVQAYAFDVKGDDGVANTGSILGLGTSWTWSCVSSASTTTGLYNISASPLGPGCNFGLR